MKINVKNRKLFQKRCDTIYPKGANYEYWICGMYYLGSVVSCFGNHICVTKRKRAYFVSGFRTLNHPEKYDKAYISLDMRNQCFTYALILFLGAILSYFISAIIAIPTYVLWGILFFKSVHLDAEKAFEKYLIK